MGQAPLLSLALAGCAYALALAASDAEADAKFYAALVTIVRENLPPCD